MAVSQWMVGPEISRRTDGAQRRYRRTAVGSQQAAPFVIVAIGEKLASAQATGGTRLLDLAPSEEASAIGSILGCRWCCTKKPRGSFSFISA